MTKTKLHCVNLSWISRTLSCLSSRTTTSVHSNHRFPGKSCGKVKLGGRGEVHQTKQD